MEIRHILVATGPLYIFAARAIWRSRPERSDPAAGLSGPKEETG